MAIKKHFSQANLHKHHNKKTEIKQHPSRDRLSGNKQQNNITLEPLDIHEI
jgi:hypothetical protein